LGLIFLSLHLHINSNAGNSRSRFEAIDFLIEIFYDSRVELVEKKKLIQRRRKLLSALENLRKRKELEQKEMRSLIIMQRGKKIGYNLIPIEDGPAAKRFCLDTEIMMVSKLARQIQRSQYTNQVFTSNEYKHPILESETNLMSYYDELKSACPKVDLRIIESFLQSFQERYISSIFLVNDSFSNYVIKDYSFPRKDYWDPIKLKKNYNSSFYFFNFTPNSPEELCQVHLLNLSFMESPSSQISSARGLFSSLVTERGSDDVVTFYSSPSEKRRFFCLLAKNAIKNSVWLGEVM
jgi:hypothetical protein